MGNNLTKYTARNIINLTYKTVAINHILYRIYLSFINGGIKTVKYYGLFQLKHKLTSYETTNLRTSAQISRRQIYFSLENQLSKEMLL
jgi:hypothetical protein